MGDDEKREIIEIGPEVRSLLEALDVGDDFSSIRKIEIYPHEVLMEVYLLDAERSKYVDGKTGEPATDMRRIYVSIGSSS